MSDASELAEAILRGRAKALADFTEYTMVGALYVLRNRPEVAEIAIKRLTREGVASIEKFLEERGES